MGTASSAEPDMLRKKPGTNEPRAYSHSRAIGENPQDGFGREEDDPRLRLQPIPNSFLSQRLFMAIPLQLAVHKEALHPAKLLLKTDKNPILILLLRGACMSAAGWERGEGPIALVVVPTKQLKRQEQRARDFQGQKESSSTHHVLRRCAAG